MRANQHITAQRHDALPKATYAHDEKTERPTAPERFLIGHNFPNQLTNCETSFRSRNWWWH